MAAVESMEEWLRTVLKERYCMDCKAPVDEGGRDEGVSRPASPLRVHLASLYAVLGKAGNHPAYADTDR